ncbi:uracil-DNA glycosylase family protein [Marinibacterium sp. SX1]|uniref:uracil-DNA glycosylase family protein n=1 Tax=Marinibacterium sp. SX1 TaxID=3388424 RepID=UPI003D1824E3
MAPLNQLMRDYLDRDWRAEMPAEWRDFFADVEPDLDGLPDWEVPEVSPPRRVHELPREAGGQPEIAHMSRAFDGLTPDQVRVVILGQDPYPRPQRATGRAFEDGLWNAEIPMAVANSLRRLLQSAAACEHPGLAISEAEDDWDSICDAIRRGAIPSPATPAYFDHLAVEDVLSVNAAWTFTGTNDAMKRAHLRMWKPVMKQLLRKLTWRDGDVPIVFLLLGADARTLFRVTVATSFRSDAIDGSTRLSTVYCDHPAYQGGRPYFACGNPMRRVNHALERLGAEPVRWWPPEH